MQESSWIWRVSGMGLWLLRLCSGFCKGSLQSTAGQGRVGLVAKEGAAYCSLCAVVVVVVVTGQDARKEAENWIAVQAVFSPWLHFCGWPQHWPFSPCTAVSPPLSAVPAKKACLGVQAFPLQKQPPPTQMSAGFFPPLLRPIEIILFCFWFLWQGNTCILEWNSSAGRSCLTIYWFSKYCWTPVPISLRQAGQFWE